MFIKNVVSVTPVVSETILWNQQNVGWMNFEGTNIFILWMQTYVKTLLHRLHLKCGKWLIS